MLHLSAAHLVGSRTLLFVGSAATDTICASVDVNLASVDNIEGFSPRPSAYWLERPLWSVLMTFLRIS